MLVRTLVVAVSLALIVPIALPPAPATAHQILKKKTLTTKPVPRYKKNFRGTRPGEPNYAELPDHCWGATWDGKDWLCFNSFDFGRFND